MKRLLPLIFLFFLSIGFSQDITGLVKDSITNEPLEGVAIYYDNTTIGTTTNTKGEFSLNYNEKIKSSLIISFLGYQTSKINVFPFKENLKIYLNESTHFLDEVLLYSNDDWSRKLKLQEFRKHYLGKSNNGESCRILNEEEIILSYNSEEKQLVATSKAPIYIKNKNLKYLIRVELHHFEVNYSHISKDKKDLTPNYVYYSGYNFFESLENAPSERTLIKRKMAYLGSTLHFMRSLARNRLLSDGYKIYLGLSQVAPNEYITITPIDDNNNVSVRLSERLNVLYNNKKYSVFESLVSEFYIDSYGNYTPLEKIRFGGDLGKQRMGDLLPLDFSVNSISSVNFSNAKAKKESFTESSGVSTNRMNISKITIKKSRVKDLYQDEIGKSKYNTRSTYFLNGAKYNGVIFENYKNGNLKREFSVKNGISKDFYNSYYENGDLSFKRTFINGKYKGWKSFYESGEIESISIISEDQEGHTHQVTKFYYENGPLQRQDKTLDDKKHVTRYDENGILYSDEYYRNGLKHGYFEYSNGNHNRRERWVNGRMVSRDNN